MSFTDKQRIELIKANGEPNLRLEFDVFKENKVSMWTHFNHNDDYLESKKMLEAVRDHLIDFLKDGAMCPFHKEFQK